MMQWNWRFQFGLRLLFRITTGCAVYFAVASVSGYVEACVTLVALLFVGTAFFRVFRPRLLVLRVCLPIVGVALLWLALVQASECFQYCQYCWDCHYRGEFRVLGFTVYEGTARETTTLRSAIARDLGKRCPHEYAGIETARSWGLIYIRNLTEWQPGALGLYDFPEWYDEDARRLVRRLSKNDPDLASEFLDKTLLKRDRKYFAQFVRDLQAAKAAEDTSCVAGPDSSAPGAGGTK